MTDDSLPLNEQATATEDYEMISNNIIISDEQTFASSTSLYYMLD